jgi:HlyD family secretion protein
VDGLDLRAPFDGTAGLGGPASGSGGLASQLPASLQSQAAQAGLGGTSGGGAARDAASVAEGAPVSSGDAVVTVTDAATLSVSADVDENNILQIRQAATADVQLDAVPNATYPAQVTGIGVTPKQQATGGGVSYQVTLALRPGGYADGSPAPWPKPGMSATVGLTVRQARNALAVPSAAIVTSGRDSTVWILSAGGTAERRVVQVGAQGDSNVQIVSGLRAGDRIVVSGADAVKQGQKVG